MFGMSSAKCNVSKKFIYASILLAFFLYGLATMGVVSVDVAVKLTTAAFAFIVVALVLSICKSFYMWRTGDRKRLHKSLILTFLLLALFCYTYVTWCYSCQGTTPWSVLISPVTGVYDNGDQRNLVTAAFAFITVAFLLMVVKLIKK